MPDAGHRTPNIARCALLHAARQHAYQAQMLGVGTQLLEHACSCAWHGTAAMFMRDLLA